MHNCCYGEVPGRVCRHAKAKKRPDPIVVKRWYENCSSTASSKNVGPCSLVQMVVDVIYITVSSSMKQQFKNTMEENPDQIFTCLMENWTYLAQAISCMTDPKRRKVQLKARPTAFQYGPSNPSSTSNHCKPKIMYSF